MLNQHAGDGHYMQEEYEKLAALLTELDEVGTGARVDLQRRYAYSQLYK